jgi:hypothetical protein
VSRIEGKISGKSKVPVDAAEILAALAREGAAGAEARRDAVSRYLSASEGWQEASNVLGGAFADDDTWLKTEKDE